MRHIGGYVIAALLCAAAGTAAFAVGRLEHRMAEAEEAMASLDFARTTRAYDELQQSMWYADYVPWITHSTIARIHAQSAAVRYWQGDYAALLDLTRDAAEGQNVDTDLLFVTANTTFRLGQQGATDPVLLSRAADDARKVYQSVLRQTPTHPDAAFNYEYMLVVRDLLAKKPGTKPAQSRGAVPKAPRQTLHGIEGGPSPGRTDEEFKTMVPQNKEERSRGTTRGGEQVLRRKG